MAAQHRLITLRVRAAAVQFSVLHPVISAPVGRWLNDESGVRQARAVREYFYQGPLAQTWTFSAAPARVRDRYQPFTITYARRTLAGWLSAVLSAGLAIEAIAEPRADEQTAAAHPPGRRHPDRPLLPHRACPQAVRASHRDQTSDARQNRTFGSSIVIRNDLGGLRPACLRDPHC